MASGVVLYDHRDQSLQLYAVTSQCIQTSISSVVCSWETEDLNLGIGHHQSVWDTDSSWGL